MSRPIPVGRKPSDREKDRAGRDRLNAELPDVRAEDRMWSDSELDAIAGQLAGDPKDADTGPVDVDLSPEELAKRLRGLGPGAMSAMMRRNSGL